MVRASGKHKRERRKIINNQNNKGWTNINNPEEYEKTIKKI